MNYQRQPEPFDALEDEAIRIVRLAIDGCKTDGAHHKQWYLEQIIDALGWSVEAVRGGEWEPGIAP